MGVKRVKGVRGEEISDFDRFATYSFDVDHAFYRF